MSLRLPAPFSVFLQVVCHSYMFQEGQKSNRSDSVDILPLFRNVLNCLGAKGWSRKIFIKYQRCPLTSGRDSPLLCRKFLPRATNIHQILWTSKHFENIQDMVSSTLEDTGRDTDPWGDWLIDRITRSQTSAGPKQRRLSLAWFCKDWRQKLGIVVIDSVWKHFLAHYLSVISQPSIN